MRGEKREHKYERRWTDERVCPVELVRGEKQHNMRETWKK